MYASQPLCSQIIETLQQSILNVKALTPFMVDIAEKLLTNSQGGRLAEMNVSPDHPPECQIVGSIVVHTVAVLSANSENPILHPFIDMLMKPAVLAVSNSKYIVIPEFVMILMFRTHSCPLCMKSKERISMV